MTRTKHLGSLLSRPEIVVAPGVYDALGALLVAEAGFETAYLSGASIAYARFGKPDLGLLSLDDVAATLAAISGRVNLPIIVDADTGFGNALNVIQTVKRLEREGAAAIQLEDQTFPKRCGHLGGKSVIATGEMTGKIRAAVDARQNPDTLIIARTDAVAVEGIDAALDRAERYAEAGADMLFVEAPGSKSDLQRIVDRFAGRQAVMANMVEGGMTPALTAADLGAMGVSLVIFPGGLARATVFMVREYLASLRQNGSTDPYRARMVDFYGLNDLLGTDEYLRTGKTYEPEEP
ncbi:MAG: isocitrate lyase/PEP mutase family protein [Gammaproteobacteria bacterium]